MFCVECGKEGKVYYNLCKNCFLKKQKLVEVPQYLDTAVCSYCGAVQLANGWTLVSMDKAIEDILQKKIKVSNRVESLQIQHKPSYENERNISLHISCELRIEDIETRVDLESRLRMKKGICPTCSKQKGRYYEGIVQVRAEGRELSEDELEQVSKIVRTILAKPSKLVGSFLSREERVRGGLDFYVGSNSLARTLAKEIQSNLGGEVSSSRKIYGRKEGKEVYRVTFLIRLPKYSLGDVLLLKNELVQVVRMGPSIGVVSLTDGMERSYKLADIRGARTLDYEVEEAIILSQSKEEIQVMDPTTMKTITLAKPPKFETNKEKITIIKTERGLFVSPIQKS